MNEPTEVQVKEFWERYGFTDRYDYDTGCGYWEHVGGDADPDLPPTDLNNLFKHAVPIAIEGIRKKLDNCRVDFAWDLLVSWWLRNLINSDFNEQVEKSLLNIFGDMGG